MMETNAIIGLLGAFGLGSVVTSGVNYWFSIKKEKNNRKFGEKKEAYIGFLDAMIRSEVEKTEQAALNVGYWSNRIQLVGSGEVIRLCERIKTTNPIGNNIHPDRPLVFQELKDAMRKDLGMN